MDVLNRVLESKLYDVLEVPFFEEYDNQGNYIPMRDRRPSVQYNLCRVVVNDSASLLFSESHFPTVYCSDETTRATLSLLIKDTLLNSTMIDAATRGSVGSIALLMSVRDKRLFFDVLKTQFLTPTFNKKPDTIDSMVELYKCSGESLRDSGYDIDKTELNNKFWFKRAWDDKREIWYLPLKVTAVNADLKWVEDKERTVTHDFGFCPMIWVKNLPGGDDPDGYCTFEAAIQTSIEVDYQLSQAGRGLKYSSQPTTVIKSDSVDGTNKQMVAGDAIVVPSNGDAKMLEIGGGAAEAVINYVRFLRELTMEQIGGNRTDASRLSAAHSGRAMELMNQSLIWLADKLRISYGEGALISLIDMMRRASNTYELTYRDGTKVTPMDLTKPISLKWAQWYPPTSEDRQADSVALSALRVNNIISQESAVEAIAPVYDIEDVQVELTRIKADAEATAQMQIKVNAASTAQEND